MTFWKTRLAVLASAAFLAACGGGGSDSPRVPFSSLVSFGDSLSDVGAYKVGTIAAVGGGKWTVNSSTARNWTEIVAADLHVAAPCAAETGLLTNIPGFTGAPVVQHPECSNYAEGSARVSNVFGPNSATLQAAPFNQVNLGLMATPVTTQVATHLARHNGAFTGNELVTVMAGGNEVFMNLPAVAAASGGGAAAVAAAVAAGWDAATQQAVAAGGAAASQTAVAAAVASMGAAGAQLAALVKTQILGKGARYVLVVNLPDVSQSPFALGRDAQTRALISQMVITFNTQLASGLQGTLLPAGQQGTPGVLLVDAYTQGREQTANPAQYGLTNVTTAACSTSSPANPLGGSSIACTQASTIAADTSRYAYADSVHPTPYGYQLIAQTVEAQLVKAGWL